MSAEIQTKSATSRVIDAMESDPISIDLNDLQNLHRVAVTDEEGFAIDRTRFDAIVDALPDEKMKALYIQAQQTREERVARSISPLLWALAMIENGFHRRLHERRLSSNLQKVQIPDPSLEIELAATYAYDIDADAIALIAKDLPEDEAAKLVTVVEEHEVPEQTVVIPAHVVPRKVTAGSTVSILAAIKRYPGTAIAVGLEAALNRRVDNEKLTIKPRASKAPKNVTPR